MKLIILLSLIASITACATTEKLVYIEPKPYVFQKVTQQQSRKIRVHDSDVELYSAYIAKFRQQIDFMNQQVDDYMESFDDK